jgi:dsDNA-specific endonuclease/ATPase MutS2
VGLLDRLRSYLDSKREDTRAYELSDDASVDPYNPFPEPVKLELTDVFDLHSIPPADVKRVIEEYLAEARKARFRSVRIIHGKGSGVQRNIVRGVLSRTGFVVHFTDAPPDAGGWGATVAHLAAD